MGEGDVDVDMKKQSVGKRAQAALVKYAG